MKANTGKIARLPRAVRDELNRRLDDGEEGGTLLAWLNALPPEATPNQRDPRPINKQNLSAWRHSGFVDWQRAEDATAIGRGILEVAADLEELGQGRPLPERMAPMLAVAMGRVLQASWQLPDGLGKNSAILQSAQVLIRLRRADYRQAKELREQKDWEDSHRMPPPRPQPSATDQSTG